MPQFESAAEGGADAVAKDSSARKIRIAIADDHTIFRDGLRKLLSLETDFEVCAEAKDGLEVLEVLRQSEPDILLLDLKMPGLDGIATLQRIQNQKLKTKIIVLTASDDEGEYVQAMKYGTSGIVLKQTAYRAAPQEHSQGVPGRDLPGREDDCGRHAAVRRARRAGWPPRTREAPSQQSGTGNRGVGRPRLQEQGNR